MAITYDYSYGLVGGALGAVVNTASTSVTLTGLTTDADYRINVVQRVEEAGVVYLSNAEEITFTPAVLPVVVDLGLLTHNVTLNSITISVPVIKELGAISSSVTLNPITSFIPITGDSYDLKITHVEGATETVIETILGTSYQLTGLVDGDNYDLSIRKTSRSNGASYLGLYSSVTSFTSTAPAVVFDVLGLITPVVTINSMVPYVDSTVRVDLGAITHNVTLNGLTPYNLGPVIKQLGVITSSVTLNSIVVYQPNPIIVNLGALALAVTVNGVSVYQPGLVTYSLRVSQDGGSTIDIGGISGSSYALTGLVDGATYTLSLILEDQTVVSNGVNYYAVRSAPYIFLSVFRPNIVATLGSISPSVTLSPLTVIDRDFNLVTITYDNSTNNFTVAGSTTHNLQSVTMTIGGDSMVTTFNGTDFDGALSIVPLLIRHMEELDGYQPLSAGNQILEVH